MKENNEITYEEKDGILYPQIRIEGDELQIGRYGRMRMKFLK